MKDLLDQSRLLTTIKLFEFTFYELEVALNGVEEPPALLVSNHQTLFSVATSFNIFTKMLASEPNLMMCSEAVRETMSIYLQ